VTKEKSLGLETVHADGLRPIPEEAMGDVLILVVQEIWCVLKDASIFLLLGFLLALLVGGGCTRPLDVC
jgi:hypothetical protein